GPVTLPAASIPDSALSSNVPLKDAVNVFLDRATFTGGTSGVAGASVVIRSASPGITIVEEDAGEDEKAWSLGRPANGRMFFSTQTDDLIGGAIPAGGIFMAVSRSGTAITEVELNGDVLDFNGNADISGTLAVGGTITGNGSGLTNLNASNLSSGTLADARLSSNVPLLNAANVFTVRQTIQRTGGSPSLTVERTESTLNAAIEAKT